MISNMAIYFINNPDIYDAKPIVEKIKSNTELHSGKYFFIKNDATFENDQFTSVTDFVMFLTRSHKLLQDKKTLLLANSDSLIAMHLNLSKVLKEQSGNPDYMLSDLLHMYNVISSITNAECNENKILTDSIQLAIKSYQSFLKDSKMMDFWQLLSLMKMEISKPDSCLKECLSNLSLIIFGKPNSFSFYEFSLIRLISQYSTLYHVTVEIPLDCSFHGSSQPYSNLPNNEIEIEINSTRMEDIFNSEMNFKETLDSKKDVRKEYCEQLMTSYLRLLVNSCDEMALAHVINGPEWTVNHNTFHQIKEEANKKKLSMYSTIVSYVQRLRLKGKGYEPESTHPFYNNNKALDGFVSIMETLYDTVEEINDVKLAIKKLITIIKKHLYKSQNSQFKKKHIDKASDLLTKIGENILYRFENNSIQATPNRTVGNGGSMLGRKSIQVIQGILDVFSSMIPPQKPISYVDTEITSSQNTPIRLPNLVKLFSTPVIDESGNDSKEVNADIFIEERSLSDRLGFVYDQKYSSKNDASTLGVGRFQSAIEWATHCSPIPKHSPIIVHQETGSESDGENIKNRKNVEEHDEKLRETANEIIHEIKLRNYEKVKEKIELAEEEEMKARIKKKYDNVRKGIKRCILDEINVSKENNGVKKQCTDNNLLNGKRKNNKKLKELPKGQKLLTSFFKK